MAGGAVGVAWVGMLIKNAMADRKLQQQQDKSDLLSAISTVKADIIKSQTDMKAELVDSDNETRGDLDVHVAEDKIRFKGIDDRFDHVDRRLDNVDQNLAAVTRMVQQKPA